MNLISYVATQHPAYLYDSFQSSLVHWLWWVVILLYEARIARAASVNKSSVSQVFVKRGWVKLAQLRGNWPELSLNHCLATVICLYRAAAEELVPAVKLLVDFKPDAQANPAPVVFHEKDLSGRNKYVIVCGD